MSSEHSGGRAASKLYVSAYEAVNCIRSGDTVMVGGFGDVGVPFALTDAVLQRGITDLTVVSNNCGTFERGLALWFKHGMVRRVYASFPAQQGNDHFATSYRSGGVELVLVPQGTLAERIRAGGAGLGGILTPTGVGTAVAEGKQLIELEGRAYLLELPLRADVALVKANIADACGNLRYRLSSRNFNPLMAMAARVTVAQVTRMVEVGDLGPDDVHTPGVFVDRLVVHAGADCG